MMDRFASARKKAEASPAFLSACDAEDRREKTREALVKLRFPEGYLSRGTVDFHVDDSRIAKRFEMMRERRFREIDVELSAAFVFARGEFSDDIKPDRIAESV
jgi:hypothetical protein